MNLDLERAQRSLYETVHAIHSLDQQALQDMAALIANLQHIQGVLWTMGNGGSSSTGSQLACDVGENGGKLSDHADVELRINSTDMQVLENVHLVVVHWLFKALTHESRNGPVNPHLHA